MFLNKNLFLIQLLLVVSLFTKLSWSRFIEVPLSNVQARAVFENSNYDLTKHLNDVEKQIFDQTIEHLTKELPDLEFDITVTGVENPDDYALTLGTVMDKVHSIMNYEYPEIFWTDRYGYGNEIIDGNIIIHYKVFSGRYVVKIPADQLKQYKEELITEKDKIINKINELGLQTDYAKLRYIHDYLVSNVYNYNDYSNNVGNLYGALVNKKAISIGIAQAFQYLSRSVGINSIYIKGKAIQSYHNYVEVKGKWYIVDVGSDDPTIEEDVTVTINPTPTDGPTVTVKKQSVNPTSGVDSNLRVDYFLIGSQYIDETGERIANITKYIPDVSTTHSEWLILPEIEKDDYAPTDEEITEVKKFDTTEKTKGVYTLNITTTTTTIAATTTTAAAAAETTKGSVSDSNKNEGNDTPSSAISISKYSLTSFIVILITVFLI